MNNAINKLEVKNLKKSFGEKSVIKDVSLSVRKGEVVGLLGPNGAGKTTCFYMTVGLLKADKGQVFFDDMDVTNLPMYQRARMGLGYLPQETSIFRGMTVEQNIYSILEVRIRGRRERMTKLKELLKEFSIEHIKKSPALALSGGERRRVEIARALASNPSFILLDEPFAGIDPLAVTDIMNMVKHLKDKGIGILVTDHNVRETLEIVDKAYIIYDGKVLMSGTPKQITSNKEVRKVYLGERFKH